MKVDRQKLEDGCVQILEAIGEDVNRDGLKDTPRRFANYWREFIEYEPGQLCTTFESVIVDQMVAVSGIKVWSLCEHHLLPFWCELSIGYIAEQKVLGLSKFGRIAHKHAHKLQLQEKLVHDIAKEVQSITQTPHVAVVGRGEHLCMTMRGIKTPSVMSSSVMWGRFRDKAEVRKEFFDLVNYS